MASQANTAIRKLAEIQAKLTKQVSLTKVGALSKPVVAKMKVMKAESVVKRNAIMKMVSSSSYKKGDMKTALEDYLHFYDDAKVTIKQATAFK